MIRRATVEDFEVVVKLASDFAKASEGIHRCQVSEAQVRDTIKYAIVSSIAILLVSELDGIVEGFLLAYLLRPCFSDEIIAQEFGLYARKAKSLIHLLDNFELEAKSLGAYKIMIGHKPKFCNMKNIYERKGYTLLEEQFMKEV
jgi:hypothetical protein